MLIFEKSHPQRRCTELPKSAIPPYALDQRFRRQDPPRLPEVAEVDLVRHYINLSKKAYGVDNGFYPLGSCTMKYNPKINEDVAALPGFTEIHPLQPASTARGCLEVIRTLSDDLCAITGMDGFTLQPAAGAHGEFTGLLMIRAYHHKHHQDHRTKIIIPDSAHGTNPASAAMVGFTIVSVASDPHGGVDIQALKELVDDETAALMLTNPNTLGLFDEHIHEITAIIHQAGGLVYYDGANLNAIMGICRPGDMGFDIVHLNLHKTFSTPHGGGGPGSGPIGCKKALCPFLPQPLLTSDQSDFDYARPDTIGQVRSFYGNFLVYVRALTYITVLGHEGLKEVSENAVLNANYLMHRLSSMYTVPYPRTCMHEFVISLAAIKEQYNVSAKDVAKSMIDYGIHPPTMYFPLIVHEALMFEPTETESRETLDMVAAVMADIYRKIKEAPEELRQAPHRTPVRQIDEVQAARHPLLHYDFK